MENQRALEAVIGGQPFEQQRNGAGLAAFLRGCFLAEHQPGGGGEGRDQMQGLGALGMIVAAPDVEPTPAGNAVIKGQEAAQEIEMRFAPIGDQVEVVAVANAAADHQEHDLVQRVRDIARIGDRGSQQNDREDRQGGIWTALRG